MQKYFKKNKDIENSMMLFDQNYYLPDESLFCKNGKSINGL